MPLSTIGTGPVEQVLEERRLNASVAAQNFRAGFDVAQFATQARLSLRAQQLQERELGLRERLAANAERMELKKNELWGRQIAMQETALQMKSEEFLEQKRRWNVEFRTMELALKQAELEDPLKAEMLRNQIQAGKLRMETEAQYAALGGEAMEIISSNTSGKIDAIANGKVPTDTQAYRQLIKTNPRLLLHPTITEALKASQQEVETFAKFWVDGPGKMARPGNLPASVQEWNEYQKMRLTDPVGAADFLNRVLPGRTTQSMPADVETFNFLEQLRASDPEAAGRFEKYLESKQRGLRVETTADGGTTITQGPLGLAGKVPPAITTQALEGGVQAMEAGRMIDKVFPMISTKTVGVGGLAGRMIDSGPLADVFPTLFSQERVEARQLLGALSTRLVQAFKSDSQINKDERQQLIALTPQLRATQSAQEARVQLIQMRSMYGEGKRKWLDAAGIAAPPELWTPDEIEAEKRRRWEYSSKQPQDLEDIARWAVEAKFRSLYPNNFNTQLNRWIERYGE